MQIVIFSSPGREEMLENIKRELLKMDVFNGNFPFNIEVIDNPESFGKRKFFERYRKAFDICLTSKYDNYLFLPDDIRDIDLDTIGLLFDRFKDEPFVCNVLSDYRQSCWGSKRRVYNDFKLNDYQFEDLGFYDCGGLTNRATIQNVQIDDIPSSWFNRPDKSSGVGYQLTKKLKANGVPMFVSNPGLAYHGEHESVMHKDARKAVPLVSIPKRLKSIIGIATFAGREQYLEKTIKSLHGQADEIIVYDNEQNPDLTDNGKFYALSIQEEPIIFFSCDDDIIYPPTYVEDMIQAIEKHQCIVTHHGRQLRGLNRSYYKGHHAFRCTDQVAISQEIDVAGTGVTAFRSDYFNPSHHIIDSPFKKMSDIVFSLEAAKQDKRILVLQHRKGYIEAQPVPVDQTIYGTEVNNADVQQGLANEIFTIKNK